MSSIRTVLFDPDTFFFRRNTSPTFVLPALVVAMLGIVGIAKSLVTVWILDGPNTPPSFPILLAISLVIPFVIWAFYGVVFYAISSLFDADGSLRDTVVLSGWGFLPTVLYSVVTLVVVAVALDPSPAARAGSQTAMEMVARGTLATLVLRSVDLLFTLWSAFVWVAAVRHARDITRRQAIVTVGIPVGIFTILDMVGLSIPV
ncbi:YIP1 family protein [Haladaptatus sp. NG-SE-30]